MDERLSVREFRKALSDALFGYEKSTVEGLGNTQGRVGKLTNPFVVYLKDPDTKQEHRVYIPMYREDLEK